MDSIHLCHKQHPRLAEALVCTSMPFHFLELFVILFIRSVINIQIPAGATRLMHCVEALFLIYVMRLGPL